MIWKKVVLPDVINSSMREIIALLESKKEDLVTPTLDYSAGDLDPVLSKETIDYHFGKLAKGYAKRYNAGEGDEKFNKNGHLLHAIYFPQFKKPKGANRPTGQVAEFIDRKFGSYEDLKEKMKEEVSEDVEYLFSEDENISDDFKKKASTIYETRVNDRVTQIVEEIEGQYAEKFEEAVTEIKTELTEKVDEYLNYVVEQWMADNQIAVESGLRAELTEEFISGLRNLFAEHYIDVPEEKVDLVDELATRVEALESQLDEEMERGMEFAKALVTARQNEITSEVCEGLTDTQEEKIKSLAESVDFSTEEEFREKVQTIRENYFPSEVKQADEETLNEKVETDADKNVSNDPFVDAVSKAITQTQK